MATTKLKTASVLAFERKHANSDAAMFAGRWEERANPDGWKAIEVQQKSVRGTISNRLKAAIANDPLKLDAEIQKPNLQTVDTAALPQDSDTLKVSFTLRVLGDLATPSACNDGDYQQALANVINGYIEREQFTELASRYAENLANARFLWRNRVGAEQIEVTVSQLSGTDVLNSWTFDAHNFDLRNFGTQPEAIKPLADLIQTGLSGKGFVLLRVEAYVRLGEGQEIFPSQELVLDGSGNSKKSKFLYQVDGQAAMHSQKIGNAIRTIDTWYPEADTFGPIAIEPYGSVTSRGAAYRQPKAKEDFYNLLDKWVLKDEAPSVGNQHYVMGVLIRGGVFGEAG
ncbi:MAG: type I-F CRISPR-associated protein Csy3 [Oceanospirillaceae bacterium]|uniref:type I-F CRISPR-associated protein Csy3 n=1 Tax=unclassified Thalassolituus TaxID=2624967 RepID=UPI000C631866|nr:MULTISPECIES: type I-F CRISPR-associated protein Csy3 [unclassified Thalassolituus]MAS24262.1 type I-F CRISPR-associated protein Csy3 [Oceanospirillaceae bacterium]MAX99723.1 type I-F CRISPR-associated protein Csy3 [Oceanospirillaceae bacterium]MBL35316.1 type I-F CRISPR-associated protein Csy3 [Oceanospirillaceae bacterium]MBS53551.1 type I-F CRISPR-associated protein Csy3 [Oceanospirillaceae bacterium]|tara:strand:+ start:627 stop:1652 length:1026 start_codon:yes stop_codon:yes gene_type:complete